MKMRYWYFIIGFMCSSQTVDAAAVCHLTLWPTAKFNVEHLSPTQLKTIDKLTELADQSLNAKPEAIADLGSAGQIDKNDPKLLSSRLAFTDADRAAILALAYTLNDNPQYLNKVQNILLNWATVNQPTGNPIDETRLEGMIWAYDLVSCHLSIENQHSIEAWLEKMRNKKMTWKFGPTTTNNNHRIHQMKMLLLLDKVLHRTNDWQHDLAEAEKYSIINLNPKTGESIDYRERDALHYHNYDLQAWLEISLISGCCHQPVFQAFHFLSNRILSHQLDGEFMHSTAKIDALRAQAGFTYAQIGGTFDVAKAAPTIATYYTLIADEPTPELWNIVENGQSSLWLEFVRDRRIFW